MLSRHTALIVLGSSASTKNSFSANFRSRPFFGPYFILTICLVKSGVASFFYLEKKIRKEGAIGDPELIFVPQRMKSTRHDLGGSGASAFKTSRD